MNHTLNIIHWIGKISLFIALASITIAGIWAPETIGLPPNFWHLYANREQMQLFINSYGFWSPMVFILIQASQVIIAPIPGEFTGAIGGILFGGAAGCLYATLGLMLGSSIAFLLGRHYGRPFIHRMLGTDYTKQLRWIKNIQSPGMIVLIYTVPGLPKDAMTYGYSLSDLSFLRFFVLSQLGRLPGTLLLTYSGASLIEQNWTHLIFLGIATLLLFLLALWIRSRIRNSKINLT